MRLPVLTTIVFAILYMYESYSNWQLKKMIKGLDDELFKYNGYVNENSED